MKENKTLSLKVHRKEGAPAPEPSAAGNRRLKLVGNRPHPTVNVTETTPKPEMVYSSLMPTIKTPLENMKPTKAQ